MPVRWNSLLIMSKRLVEQKRAINQYAYDRNDQANYTLRSHEWALLEVLVKLLTPIEELSLIFLKSTLSTQLPYAKILVSKLKNLDLTVENSDGIKITIPEIETARNKLIGQIEKRFLTHEKTM